MNLYDEFGRTSKECTPFFSSKMFTKICTTERKKLTLHIQSIWTFGHGVNRFAIG